MRPIAPSVPLKLIGWQLMNSLKLHCLATGASLGLVVLSVFSMLAACASKAAELLVHPGDSGFPQFAPRDVPDLTYESFLPSQILEVGQK
ncbi:hypothetical protein Tco_0138575 [Tanacetum coccineum]